MLTINNNLAFDQLTSAVHKLFLLIHVYVKRDAVTERLRDIKTNIRFTPCEFLARNSSPYIGLNPLTLWA